LKILMTTDAAGGVWQYSLDLSAGLTGRGAEVTLAVMGPRPSDAQRGQARAIPGIEIFEGDYALEWMPQPWSDVDAAGPWLLNLQTRCSADVIHLNGYSHAALTWNRPVVSVAHSCVFSWWRAVHGCSPPPEWIEYQTRVTRGLSAASAIVAPTAAMADNLRLDYPDAVKQARVIHNFSRAPRRGDVKKEPLLLAAGRVWDEAKNLRMLAELRSSLEWELRIADGTVSHAQLLGEMARASIFVHPALYEPFGLSVLEAARAGCCLLLADIPSLRELWQGAAVFIDPKSPGTWIREMNRLADDTAECTRLGQLAQIHSRRYEGDRAIQQYWELYQELMNGSDVEKKEAAA
jgi:glycogen synthase